VLKSGGFFLTQPSRALYFDLMLRMSFVLRLSLLAQREQ